MHADVSELPPLPPDPPPPDVPPVPPGSSTYWQTSPHADSAPIAVHDTELKPLAQTLALLAENVLTGRLSQ